MNFAKSAGLNSPDEIIGKNDYDMPWSREESDFYRKVDKTVMDSGESQINFEEPQTINDGTVRWLRTSKIPLFDAEKNNVIGILGAYEDITARKLAELELIESNQRLKKLNSKLEIINIDLEQFAYATSHDLQEPLRVIANFVDLLDKEYSKSLDGEGIRYLEFIKEGAFRMSDLINQILSYSELGKVEESYTKSDFRILLNEVLKNINQLIKVKNVTLDINLPNQKILCQPNRIKMLLYNLIINGIKFNQSEFPKIQINYEEHDENWHFKVSDNGIGIHHDYQNTIFKPFKRLNTRDKFSGNGIGLSVCKRIIYLHEGQIWFSNNKINGTTFHFTINKQITFNNV